MRLPRRGSALSARKPALLIGSLMVFVFLVLSTSTAGAAALPDGPEYRIGPEDVLDISVWREETLQKKVLVRPDGGITFPLVGDVVVAGKTTDEVKREITSRLARYIPNAVVTVSLATLSGYQIYVLGKVNNPGKFVTGSYMDVIKALTLAGGLTPFADEDEIKILRRERGKSVVYPFSYGDVKRGRQMQTNIVLQSGDVVLVP